MHNFRLLWLNPLPFCFFFSSEGTGEKESLFSEILLGNSAIKINSNKLHGETQCFLTQQTFRDEIKAPCSVSSILSINFFKNANISEIYISITLISRLLRTILINRSHNSYKIFDIGFMIKKQNQRYLLQLLQRIKTS